jgi:broad specificity phosphatase PhoE
MTILLSRHAQSPENLHGKGALGELAQIKLPLTEEGERQATILGKKLVKWCRDNGHDKVRIYASRYQRVQDTAKRAEIELIHAGIPFTFVTDPHLSEVDFLPRGAELKPGRILFGDRAMASETLAGVERRLNLVLREIRQDEKAGLPVIVLTHSTVMRGLAALLTGNSIEDISNFPRPNNCALWQIEGSEIAKQEYFSGFVPPARKQAREDATMVRTLASLPAKKNWIRPGLYR